MAQPDRWAESVFDRRRVVWGDSWAFVVSWSMVEENEKPG